MISSCMINNIRMLIRNQFKSVMNIIYIVWIIRYFIQWLMRYLELKIRMICKFNKMMCELHVRFQTFDLVLYVMFTSSQKKQVCVSSKCMFSTCSQQHIFCNWDCYTVQNLIQILSAVILHWLQVFKLHRNYKSLFQNEF